VIVLNSKHLHYKFSKAEIPLAVKHWKRFSMALEMEEKKKLKQNILSFSSCQRFRHDNRPGMVSQCCGHVNL
jgi:hypothetical protein